MEGGQHGNMKYQNKEKEKGKKRKERKLTGAHTHRAKMDMETPPIVKND